jgi:two-component system, chemotaxis family, protein-glutamate methylesterase/glutaminase
MTSRFSGDFDTQELGVPSGYTCPCRVGRAGTADALLAARDHEIDGARWVALRSPQEKAELARQLAERAGPGPVAHRYHLLAAKSERAIGVLSDRLAANASDRDDAGG